MQMNQRQHTDVLTLSPAGKPTPSHGDGKATEGEATAGF